MAKILVTGGAGYIGSHTVLELLKANYDVVVIDNLLNSNEESLKRVEKLTDKSVPFYKGDCRDYNLVNEIFKTHKIDAVIHFAGLKAVGESTKIPLSYYDNNLNSTITLLKVMKEHSVNSLVFSSSATVYNDNLAFEYIENETKVNRAMSPYGTSKVVQEYILEDMVNSEEFPDGLKVISLRYFNPVGADKSGQIGEDPLGIPNNLTPFITQVAIGKRESLSIFGNDYDTKDGTCVRDYIHVSDLAYGHLLAVKKIIDDVDSYFDAINLGTGKGYTVLEMLSAFEKAVGKPIPHIFTERRSGDLPEMFAGTQKAKEILGFVAQQGIDEMAQDAWNWQKNNPNGFSS